MSKFNFYFLLFFEFLFFGSVNKNFSKKKFDSGPGTDIEKLPSITPHACKNGGVKVGDKTNGCEPIFVYMIKKKTPVGKS